MKARKSDPYYVLRSQTQYYSIMCMLLGLYIYKYVGSPNYKEIKCLSQCLYGSYGSPCHIKK